MVIPLSSPSRICSLSLLVLLALAGIPFAHADGKSAPARVTLHEDLVRAWQGEERKVDLNDLRSVFWFVFSKFPPEVRVYPSENYYYWPLDGGGRHISGNFRLPAKHRDNGIVSFAYSERRVLKAKFDPSRIAGRAMLGFEDGVTLTKVRRGVYDLGYSDHFVRFHLEDLSQSAPGADYLLEGGEFVGRTLDESGLRFVEERRGSWDDGALDRAR